MPNKAKKAAFMGIMLSVMLVLVSIELMLPPFPMLPPQFGRVGLGNIIVMYIIFFVGKKEAVLAVFLKAGFGFIMRGPLAGVLSLCGGLLSVFFIFMLMFAFKDLGKVTLSAAGAVGHNIGQLLMACFFLGNWRLFVFYFPVLLISGVVFGVIVGGILKIVLRRIPTSL